MSRLSRFLNQWRQRSLAREFDEEVRFHLDARAEANVRRGMTRVEAEAEARRHFGSTLRAREGMREARINGWLEGFLRDWQHGLRVVWRQRSVSALAILTLALGTGATTAMFSVVNSVLINPLPYPDSDNLVSIVHTVDGVDENFFGDPIYLIYSENNRTFQGIGVWSPYSSAATITGNGDPEEVRALGVSHSLLTTLGVRPEIGRGFSSGDDTPGAPGTVMLTHAYWQQRFGADPRVLERTLTVNARPHQIIGVMPEGFRFEGERDVILPLRIDRARPFPGWRLLGVARVKPGITLAQANADVARMIPIWSKDAAGSSSVFRNTRYGPSLRPLKQDVVGNVGTTLWILMGTIGIVLLMACANVANLLLVRADARRQEFAIRVALGARWTRVARVLLVESLALALLGGALGTALAYGGLRVLVANGPSTLPRLAEISIDTPVLGFALLVSLVSGLLFGIIPILKYAGPRIADAAGAGGRGASLSRDRQRSQHTLVTLQMALALVLLVSSGLMIRSFQALRSVEPGFAEPHRIQAFTIAIPPTEIAEPEHVTRTQQEILDKVAAIPGVASAAFTTRLPMDTTGRTSYPLVPEDKAEDGKTPPSRQLRSVSPGFFQTLGSPLIAGREFTWTDTYEAREVVILSENLAREWWGSAGRAIGKRIREGNAGPWREVVGVARDIYDAGADQKPVETAFFPLRRRSQTLELPGLARRVSFIVRTERAGSESLLGQLRDAVRSVNANLPLAQVRTLGDLYDLSMARTSFTMVMLVIAGSMALLLGICGIYGVISYAVSQRRREIGIRMALGAKAPDIRGLFVRRGLMLTGAGVATGLAGAAGLTRVMQSVLFGTSPLDPMTFTAMPLVLAAVAVLASYLPARRATAIDPVETMRVE